MFKPELNKIYLWEYQGHQKLVEVTGISEHSDHRGYYLSVVPLIRGVRQSNYGFGTMSQCLNPEEVSLLDIMMTQL
jgi:hypothetical protein